MKKRIIILGSVVVFVLLAWSVAWFVLAGIVRQNVEALAQADGVNEPRLACETLGVGGFPFRFDVECQTAEITSGDFTVAVPDIRASVRAYAPTHLLASARGPVEIADNFTGTRNRVTWSTLDASIRVADWRIARLSISGKDVVWSDTLFGDNTIAQTALAELHLFDIPEQHDAERHLASLAGYLRTQDLTYPAVTLSNATAEVELELTGMPDDIRNWSDPNLLPVLQANGSELRIVSVHATDADATLDADGKLALDPQGLVNGQIAIRSTGVAERIGPMIEEPWRTLVLGTPGADGTYANQLNFSGGVMSSGLVPVTAIPPLF